ncbi:MAG: phage tail protein [Candidatus Omnitrophota bacterium]|jgi:hypothetical protein
MSQFNLIANGNVNIQTTFRYEVKFPSGAANGALNDSITIFCTSAQIPKAIQNAIEWHAPMGVVSHQAGKRPIEPISLEFVVPAASDIANDVYRMMSAWCHTTFDLTTGFNTGKANYAVDNIQIILKDGSGNPVHTFSLFRAFPTSVEFGTVNSEGSELLKASMTLTYDYFKLDSLGTSV